MKRNLSLLLALMAFALPALADPPTGLSEWKEKPKESFSDAEENFRLVMKKLLDHYVDRSVTEEELYRAATAGMLESLNDGPDPWNRLISPDELAALRSELSGKVSGIGIGIKWDESRGYGRIIHVIAGSAAEKAGLKLDDEILSVDGKRFKGRPFRDLVYAIRGKEGGSVRLKVLREDQLVDVALKRERISWNDVELQRIDATTEYLSLSYFTEDTPGQVRARLKEVGANGTRHLIVDLRDNSGGGFDQAVETAGLFLPEGTIVAKTRDRAGTEKDFRAQGGLLDPSVRVTALVNHGTSCGGELLAAALRDGRKAGLVGTATFGKWNAQTLEPLPNHFAVKYTVENFFSPDGESFQGTGIKPDLEIPLANGDSAEDLRQISDLRQRTLRDPQLRAAEEIDRSGS